MKAEFDINGMLHIYPDTNAEYVILNDEIDYEIEVHMPVDDADKEFEEKVEAEVKKRLADILSVNNEKCGIPVFMDDGSAPIKYYGVPEITCQNLTVNTSNGVQLESK